MVILVGFLLLTVGFLLAVKAPPKEWKLMWGFCLIVVGILCILGAVMF